MLTSRWTQLKPHELQSRLWRSKARIVNVFAGRGSGKTELAKRRVVRYLPVKKPWPNPIYFYALPTRPWANRVAWQDLIDLVPKDWLAKEPSLSERTIQTKFGSTLYVLGLDDPERSIEGVQWDGGVFDESCDIKKKVVDRSLLPALSWKNGWLWRIGAPKRYGKGAAEFRKACEDGLAGLDPEIETYTWPSSDILTPEQLALAQRTLDAKDYNEQYNACWEDAGGGIFHAFSEESNVRRCVYNPDLPIVVGCDFNVDPMCWVMCHIIENERLEVFDELFVRNTNTVESLNHLHVRYPKHESGWHFYGDASSSARRTSASKSDYRHIHNDERFTHKRMFIPKSNPRILDRFASCNALMTNAAGQHRLFIDPSCVRLINDIEVRAYKEGFQIPDDGADIGHITDAIGYIIHRRFPIRLISPIEIPEAAIYVGE